MRKSSYLSLVQSAVIAALYTVFTYVSAIGGFAYGPVQFRLSEAFTLLPILTPAAIPGLILGCILSNLGSPLGFVDILFGTLATALAAVATRMTRKLRVFSLPILSALFPVLFNAVIVGIEICLFSSGSFVLSDLSFAAFWPNMLSVGAGELAVCFLLGIPLVVLLEKTGEAKKIF